MAMPRRTNNRVPLDVAPIVRLWILRLLVPLRGHRELIDDYSISNDDVAQLLGLGHWIDPLPNKFDPKKARSELRALHKVGERELIDAIVPPLLGRNVERLSNLIGLSNTDRCILEFVVLMHSERLLGRVAAFVDRLSSDMVFHALSVLLDLPERDIQLSLSAHGILVKSGLVTVACHRDTGTLRAKLDILSYDFANQMCVSEGDPMEFLRGSVVLSAPAQLELSDYGHIASSLGILCPFIKHALGIGRPGVNIFLHGSPGTGKSELARTLAKELECHLFEISSEDDSGDPVDGEGRLRAFRAAQSFFAKQRALLVFDEVEDVFNDGNNFLGRKSIAQTRKAWINRMLEENSVPTLWLSNSIHDLDPAFIRRFDMVVELPIPSKQQRIRIIQAACNDLLDAGVAARIAESESLAPAIITRAASVVRAIREELGEAGTAPAFEFLIGNTLEAQGHKSIRRNDPNRLPELYDQAFTQADANLTDVAAGMVASKTGRLCLYGPPGTGKTAYARWLADQIGVPLVVKRASDLMSKWLGENEKNIARTFKQAEQDGAMLLIDEVDSFLQDRRGAERGWEVSQVNEMLTQMESFPGVFVATTNLMSGIDQAALRRFDLKVKFDFMRPAQAKELFCRYCTHMHVGEPQLEDLAKIMLLRNLTPGDFSTAVRQNQFRAIRSPAALAAVLATECTAKENTKAAIGFL